MNLPQSTSTVSKILTHPFSTYRSRLLAVLSKRFLSLLNKHHDFSSTLSLHAFYPALPAIIASGTPRRLRRF